MTLLAGIGASFGVAVVLAIANLAITGHGGKELNTTLLSVPTLGISLGLADIIMLGVGVTVSVVVWRSTAAAPGGA